MSIKVKIEEKDATEMFALIDKYNETAHELSDLHKKLWEIAYTVTGSDPEKKYILHTEHRDLGLIILEERSVDEIIAAKLVDKHLEILKQMAVDANDEEETGNHVIH